MFDDDDEEEDTFRCSKFEDCRECRHQYTEAICDTCDVGEEFEEQDHDELDKYFVGRI